MSVILLFCLYDSLSVIIDIKFIRVFLLKVLKEKGMIDESLKSPIVLILYIQYTVDVLLG